MTLDANALLAITCQEPGWEQLVERVLAAEHPRVPATALAEAGMILSAQDSMLAVSMLQDLVRDLRLTVVPFTERDWFDAVIEYTRRRRSPTVDAARFGDCLSAGVAARAGSTLLSAPGERRPTR